jgi:hypothetical protein
MTDNEKAVTRVAEALLFAVQHRNGERPVIPIFGAGASINSGVPSGNYLMERIACDLRPLVNTVYWKKLGNRAVSAAEAIHKDPLDLSFEGVLSIYGSIFSDKGLYQWLSTHIHIPGVEYFPAFTHEYCAHLVSGGFLKYFVSFNFDEILENALEEELGRATFQVIASESEFNRLKDKKREEWDGEFRQHPRCYVLKPHGTISRQKSLRHRSEDVRRFGADKEPVLQELLRGSLLLLLGFGHYNEDGWLLFAETYSRGVTGDIVVVDTAPERIRNRIKSTGITQVCFYEQTTDKFFEDLARKLHGSQELQKHQRPTRHHVRSLFFGLFSRRLTRMAEEDQHREQVDGLRKIGKRWFHERIYELELLIYLFKTRGLFVDLATAHCHRVKEALDQCLPSNVEDPQDLRVWSVLKKVLSENVAYSSIRDRFDLNALNTHWCFLLMPPNCEFGPQSGDAELVAKGCATAFANWILAQLPTGSFHHDRLGGDFRRKLAEHLEELCLSFDVDVSGEDRSIGLRFEAPTIIRHREQFAEHTTRLLTSNGWNCLRVAAVAAEWLVKELEEAYPHGMACHREITIVSNLDMFTSKPEAKDYDSSCDGYVPLQLFHYRQMVRSIARLLGYVDRRGNELCLTWYAFRNLEHHMSIVSDKQGTTTESFNGATYFWRAGKNTSVSPVALNKPEDVRDLAKYFDARIAQSSSWLSDKKSGGRILEKQTGRPVIIQHGKTNPVLRNLASALQQLRLDVKDP